MHNLWIPQGICDDIDASIQRFIWKGTTARGIHLVGWESITQLKERGCLGLRKDRDHNVALLGKNVWQIIKGESKPWVTLLKGKYVVHGILLSSDPSGGSAVWRSISRALDQLRDGFSFKIGNGNSSFWFLDWLGRYNLCDRVPWVDIHDLEVRICDVVDGEGRRNLSGLYTLLPTELQEVIYQSSVLMHGNISDCYTWKGDASGEFSMRSGFHWLMYKVVSDVGGTGQSAREGS